MMMFPGIMFQESISVSNNGNGSSAPRVHDLGMNPMMHNSSSTHQDPQIKAKKKRNPPGNPHPDSEVVALSPRTLMATDRFVCEVCNKAFQRDQNLQLHRRGHNLPWKPKQRNNKEMKKKRVYICPEKTCVHNDASRALGDITGIKKHFCRKHGGEKKWKCDMCAKLYAVESDWKAHMKTCGTKEYKCNCGAVFTRKDHFATHRAFCDALAEESARPSAATTASNSIPPSPSNPNTTAPPPPPPSSSFFPFSSPHHDYTNTWEPLPLMSPHNSPAEDEPYIPRLPLNHENRPASPMGLPPFGHYGINSPMPPPLSATALLHKAASIGAAVGQPSSLSMAHLDMQSWAHKRIGTDVGQVGSASIGHVDMQPWAQSTGGFTRDFMGLTDHSSRVGGGGSEGSSSGARGSNTANVREMMSFEPSLYDRDHYSFMELHQPVFRFSNPDWENC